MKSATTKGKKSKSGSIPSCVIPPGGLNKLKTTTTSAAPSHGLNKPTKVPNPVPPPSAVIHNKKLPSQVPAAPPAVVHKRNTPSPVPVAENKSSKTPSPVVLVVPEGPPTVLNQSNGDTPKESVTTYSATTKSNGVSDSIAKPPEPLAVAPTTTVMKTVPKRVRPKKEVMPQVIGHPLQCTWTLWYINTSRSKNNNKSTNWEDQMQCIHSFSTAEKFWALYEGIKDASELEFGSSYYLFKQGIKPAWEDVHNRRGGRWLISLDVNLRARIHEFWLEILMCLIGEMFGEESDDICGASYDCRPKGHKLSIWTADCNNFGSLMKIGIFIKQRLESLVGDCFFEQGQFKYERHNCSAGLCFL